MGLILLVWSLVVWVETSAVTWRPNETLHFESRDVCEGTRDVLIKLIQAGERVSECREGES